MSMWGIKDNVMLTGNVTTVTTSKSIQGFGTIFLLEVDPGDYVAIAGNKYQVANVTSNSALALTASAATNSANVRAYVQNGPKYIANVDTVNNVYTIQNVLGIDLNEAKVPANRAKGLKTQGWVHHQTWTGQGGSTRYRSEVLVALSKNFTASNAGDWADDSTVLDYLLYFSTQPSNKVNLVANVSTTLVSVAASDPAGASITYQWYESPNNIVFAALTNAGVYSGVATNTLAISNVANLNGRYYKVTIANTNATTNTSNIVTITTV